MAKSDRDILLKLKLLLPERFWRMGTRPVAWVLQRLPVEVKYKRGLRSRQGRRPYSVIEPGDVVFQVGAPSDLLAVGRSRAAYFLHLVSDGGKLVVMEPDTINCKELTEFAQRLGMSDKLIVVPAGGWDSDSTLKFFQSREHPASAVLANLSEASPEEIKRRGYQEIEVPVRTIDSVCDEYLLPVPKLVSVTTNGAELTILNGLQNTFKKGGPEFISLAITDDGYVEAMEELGYTHVADDDRGFTFQRIA